MSDASSDRPLVGIVMGSDSDWPIMEAAADALTEFGVPHEVDVVSAHRMPLDMLDYGRTAADRGLRVLVAGAGRSRSPAGDARVGDPAARDRRAGPAQAPRRDGLAAVHRPDARGRPGGDGVGGRRAQRRACSPCGSWPRPTSRCASGWSTSRPRCTPRRSPRARRCVGVAPAPPASPRADSWRSREPSASRSVLAATEEAPCGLSGSWSSRCPRRLRFGRRHRDDRRRTWREHHRGEPGRVGVGRRHPRACRARAGTAARRHRRDRCAPLPVEWQDIEEEGSGSGVVASWADSGLDRFVAELRKPDQAPPADGVCPAIYIATPWFAIVTADGRVVRAAVPKGACGQPRESALEALAGLPWTVLSETRLRQNETPEAQQAGCPENWKDMVAIDAADGSGRPAAEAPCWGLGCRAGSACASTPQTGHRSTNPRRRLPVRTDPQGPGARGGLRRPRVRSCGRALQRPGDGVRGPDARGQGRPHGRDRRLRPRADRGGGAAAGPLPLRRCGSRRPRGGRGRGTSSRRRARRRVEHVATVEDAPVGDQLDRSPRGRARGTPTTRSAAGRRRRRRRRRPRIGIAQLRVARRWRCPWPWGRGRRRSAPSRCERGRDVERRGVADVVGVRLERRAEDGDADAAHVAADHLAGELDHPAASSEVDRVDLSQERERLVDAELTGPSHERADVLGQATAAEAEARVEEAPADPFVVRQGLRRAS